MTTKYAKKVAYTIQALLGLHTGFFINLYIAVFGQAGTPFINLDPKLIGITWIGLIFLMEYPLELFGGALADRLGSKPTFIASFILRMLFPLGMAAFLIWYPPTSLASYLFTGWVLSLCLSVSFTLLSGNFEIWLIGLCDSDKEGQTSFLWSETLFWSGLTLGGLCSLIVGHNTSFMISSFCSLVAAIICFSIKEHGQNRQQEKRHTYDKENKNFFDLVKKANPLLKTQIPDVNRVFWVLAIIYGLAQMIEALIPAYYVLNKKLTIESLVIVIGCLWLPSLIGAVWKTPLIENILPRSIPILSQSPNSIGILRRLSIKYALLSSLIPLAILIDHEMVGLIILGVIVFFSRIFYGSLRPLFKNYAAHRIHNMAQSLPDKMRETFGEKTIMSIGEQRMKIGAFISILPFYFGEVLKVSNLIDEYYTSQSSWLYFAPLGFIALTLALISLVLLRDRKTESPSPTR